jgi:hypothetical protein
MREFDIVVNRDTVHHGLLPALQRGLLMMATAQGRG